MGETTCGWSVRGEGTNIVSRKRRLVLSRRAFQVFVHLGGGLMNYVWDNSHFGKWSLEKSLWDGPIKDALGRCHGQVHARYPYHLLYFNLVASFLLVIVLDFR